MMQQCVHQRARGRARRGVNDHPRRLVDDDQIAVLEDHRQGDGLGTRLDLGGDGQAQHIDLAGARARLGVGHRNAAAQHITLCDHPHQSRARQRSLLWHGGGKRLIKTLGRILAQGDLKHLARIVVIVAGKESHV